MNLKNTIQQNLPRLRYLCVWPVQEILSLLLDYEAKVEQLFYASGEVVPLHLRKENLESPVRIQALIDYEHSKVRDWAFIFFHLKLQLLTQFPASNDDKYCYL